MIWSLLSSFTHRFQKLHLACGSERLVLRSPLQPFISLCEAPASPLQLPGGNVTITYTYVGGRAPMGQGFLLSYSQGMQKKDVCKDRGNPGRGSDPVHLTTLLPVQIG